MLLETEYKARVWLFAYGCWPVARIEGLEKNRNSMVLKTSNPQIVTGVKQLKVKLP